MAALRSFAALAATALFTYVQATHIDLPACTAPFRPFVYSGCFADNTASGATLSFHSDADRYNMTVEGCMAECKGNGFRYAGLEYYGECYCGNSVNGPSVDESKCNYPCTGNKSEVCGGSNIISVYQDTTFNPIDETIISDYVSVGCYWDKSTSGKALSYPQNAVNGATLTTEKCLAQCKKGGYPFAGTEYSGECYCGVVLGNYTYQVADSECNMPCKGDKSQICGGSSRLSLYVSKQLESIEPCGYVPPPVVSSSTTVIQSSTVTPEPSSTTEEPYTSTTEEPETSTTEEPETSTTEEPETSTTEEPETSTTEVPEVSTTEEPETSTTEEPETSTTEEPTTSTEPPSTTTKPTSKTSTSTSCTSTTKPATTSKPVTTTKPPTTTPKPTTTSTSICYSTTTIPSTCEYKCGKWCNDALPDFGDQTGCKSSHSNCKLQIASCFLSAGWPDSLKCFDFADWCSDVKDYCSTNPSKVKNYGKGNCFASKPPKGGSPPTTKTVTVPCAPTTTAKTTAKPSTTTQCPIPTVTNICKQPTNRQYGYDAENPVGDIELPVVTCNDLKSEFASKPFKLYTNSDSKKCGGYGRPQVPNACADACKAQYDQCTATYAEGCRQPAQSGKGGKNYWDSWFGGGKRYRFARSSEDVPQTLSDIRKELKKRTRWSWSGDNYNGALNKCKAQYNDCLSLNRGVSVNGKCGSFGSGW